MQQMSVGVSSLENTKQFLGITNPLFQLSTWTKYSNKCI